MEGFFIFILVFGFVLFLQGMPTGKKPHPDRRSDVRKRLKSWSTSETDANSKRSSRPKTGVARQMSQRQMTQMAVRKGAAHVRDMDSLRDKNDKNRQRRNDWGERARPGLFSLRNTILLIGLGVLALWLMSSIPTEGLR